MTVQEWLGESNKIGIDIWEKKYRYTDENGRAESFDEWLDRVCGGDDDVRDLILKKKFLFGGRILANRGIDGYNPKMKFSLSNCYVSTTGDSIEEIFDCAKKIARTYSYGGGVGVDIGCLSPKGALVHNAAKQSTGAVSFMDLYSLVTGLIGQSGRRGALMISMPVNHPDIEEFIDVKKDLDRVTKANISIRVTDDFMEAVRNHEKYKLSFTREETGEVIEKEVDAFDLMMKLAQNNWEMAEPGVLMWSRIENWNLLSGYHDFKYAGVNPCAEEPLPKGGSCCLGSINLSEYVLHDAYLNPFFNYDEFESDIITIVKAMNNVLDEGLPRHPLEEQRESVSNWRQIGIGIMGVADMLIKLGKRYGSTDAASICGGIGYRLINAAVLASASLAKMSGSFPKFNLESTMASEFFNSNLEQRTKDAVKAFGLRNSQLLTIAPCGTLSTMLGISGGIEPIFANYYERKTESLFGKDVYYKVYTPIVEEYMKSHGITDDKDLPSFFITSQTLDYHERIRMQSVWQKYIDASISSTVNLPETATVDDVFNIYMEAWEKGLKGVTIYRQNCRRTGILTTSEHKKDESAESAASELTDPGSVVYDSITPVSRKKLGTTHGDTFCKRCACGTLYITVNCDDKGHIVETFVNATKGGICKANVSAVNRLISLAMRSGVKIDEIIDQIKSIDCPACTKVRTGGHNLDGMSCPDIIAKTIREFRQVYRSRINTECKPEEPVVSDEREEMPDHCPVCGTKLIHSGGCARCLECNWSKCFD